MTTGFVVIANGEEQAGTPTPFLIEAAPCEAYFVASTDSRYPGAWYAKAPGYEAPDGQYQRVTIRHKDEYKVTLTIAPRDESLHESEWPAEYTDAFYVDALDKIDAESKARDEAITDVRRTYGDDCTAFITVVYTTKRD